MKKSWIFAVWLTVTVILVLLVFEPVKKPKEVETAKQSAQRSPATALKAPTDKFYKMLPDEIYLCEERLILDENKKQKLAEILGRESKNYTPEKIREIMERDVWYTYLKDEPANTNFPEDLKYVVFAESGLNPQARSQKEAVGPWQFMEKTAREFLRVEPENNYDERHDFVKSTEAARKHLRELYGRLGSWSAALAAYNTGEKNLQTAMDRENTKDFYQLRTIQPETQDFPFRVLAIKLIFQNSRLRDPFSQNRWLSSIKYTDWEIVQVKIKLQRQTSINEIIQLLKPDYLDLSYETFVKYNRHILGDLGTGTYTAYIVQKRSGTS